MPATRMSTEAIPVDCLQGGVFSAIILSNGENIVIEHPHVEAGDVNTVHFDRQPDETRPKRGASPRSYVLGYSDSEFRRLQFQVTSFGT
jgi:hypothetical protein